MDIDDLTGKRRSCCSLDCTMLMEGSTGIEVSRALTSYETMNFPGCSWTDLMCLTNCWVVRRLVHQGLDDVCQLLGPLLDTMGLRWGTNFVYFGESLQGVPTHPGSPPIFGNNFTTLVPYMVSMHVGRYNIFPQI